MVNEELSVYADSFFGLYGLILLSEIGISLLFLQEISSMIDVSIKKEDFCPYIVKTRSAVTI